MKSVFARGAAFLLLVSACATNVSVDPEGYKCDLNGACPAGYQCVDFICRKSAANMCGGMLCAPPANVCVDANTLRTFSASCDTATMRCLTAPTDSTCPQGCLDGRCRGTVERCNGVTCDMPPADRCTDTSTLSTWESAGTCGTDGGCQYAVTQKSCSAGCDNGHCIDPCAGKTCTTPPAATCDNATTLRTFAATGTCSATTGACDYAATTMTCANGCANGQCQNQNLCAGVTCTTPPSTVCMGNQLRTWASSGTCNMGTGQCSYTFTDMACPSNQCAQGACIAPSLTFRQVGPRLKFAVRALDVAPNSLGQLALAVGASGQVAQWNGLTNTWVSLNTPSNSPTLNAVAFATANIAYIVGSGRTVWRYTAGTPGTVAAVSGISTLAGANFIAVHARGESDVLIAPETGGAVSYDGTSWSYAAFPTLDGPFTMRAAYIDDTNRERIVGTCGLIDEPCLLYRNPVNGTSFAANYSPSSSNPPFSAVGPSVDYTTTAPIDAFVGDTDSNFYRHNNGGTSVVTQSLASPLLGAGIVGITGGTPVGANRPVFVLATPSPTLNGTLYRLTRGASSIQVDAVLDVANDSAVLSMNEAAGVLVAETRATPGTSNVFRRNAVLGNTNPDEALDIGEDFSGLATDGTAVFAATNVGDVTIRRATGTLEFRRGPYAQFHDADARGSGVLLVGENGGTNNGQVTKLSGATWQTFGSAAPVTGVVFYGVCRNSDAEGFAVGNGGNIYAVNSTGTTPTLTRMTSGVSLTLNSVECTGAGTAVACGNGGNVLRYANGTWSPVSPALPTTKNLAGCRVHNGAIYAFGDNAFYRLDPGGSAWVQLPGQPQLKYLILRSATEGYITSSNGNGSTDIYRFDGSNLSKILSFTGVIGGGVQVGGKVVYVGARGVIVEGQ